MVGKLSDRRSLYHADVHGALAGVSADIAAHSHGRIRRASGWSGTTRCAQVWRRPGIGLHLPPGKGRVTAAGHVALGNLPGAADLGTSAADPAAWRCIIGLRGGADGG